MTGFLDAIENYAEMEDRSMSDIYSSSNRINRVGDRLEYFTKDLFCNSFDLETKEEKRKQYSKHFSWLGTKNHPPDFIIEDGEAFEVKKVKSKKGSIQLNSSHPHQKLKNSYGKITKACKTCEDENGGWKEKDLVYVLGRVPSGKKDLDFMWMVYGDCWAAPEEIYQNLSNKISNKVNKAVGELEYGELSEKTNELGKVHNADPVGRAKLRIRGMWTIKHPANYFSKFIDNYEQKINGKQPLFALIRKNKFMEFPHEKRERIKKHGEINMKEIEIPDPANPAKNVKALIFETGI